MSGCLLMSLILAYWPSGVLHRQYNFWRQKKGINKHHTTRFFPHPLPLTGSPYAPVPHLAALMQSLQPTWMGIMSKQKIPEAGSAVWKVCGAPAVWPASMLPCSTTTRTLARPWAGWWGPQPAQASCRLCHGRGDQATARSGAGREASGEELGVTQAEKTVKREKELLKFPERWIDHWKREVLKAACSWHSLTYLPAHFPWQGCCPQNPTRAVATTPQQRMMWGTDGGFLSPLLCSTASCLPPTALLPCSAFVVGLNVG